MTDWDRLTDYIHDYFPDPSFSTKEVEKWADESVPAWKYMRKHDKKEVIQDWEDFVAPQIEKSIETKSPRIWERIRNFLRRKKR